MKGAIFDLDGVLVDTAKYHYQAWKRLANSVGVEFSLDDNEHLKGVSRAESLEIILKKGNIEKSAEEKQSLMDIKNEWYLELAAEMNADEALPGAIPFLESCKSKGIKIALGSSSKNAPMILERLGITHLFDAIVDGNVVSKSKPDPTVFLTAAEKLGLAPSECIVFEDAISGVQAAKTGGFYCVGIGTKEVLPLADEIATTLGEYSVR
jgi:beta-phosphoglucomutase